MQYLKRNTKYSIFAFLVIVLSITISIPTLAKTEVYFSLYDNPQILSTTSPKPEVQTINSNIESQNEFIIILKISEPIVQKIINLSENRSRRFKEPKVLLQLSEFTNFDFRVGDEKKG